MHRKISKCEKQRGEIMLEAIKAQQIIDEYDAGKITIYLEALEAGSIESAKRVFNWTLDTHLRDQALKIISTLDLEGNGEFPVVY